MEVVFEDIVGGRHPDGISYSSATYRFTGWQHPVTDMNMRNADDITHRPGYESVVVDRTLPKPWGNYNWQRGLTLPWVIPTGHFCLTTKEGIRRYLAHRPDSSEIQPRTLLPGERCTHVQPVLDYIIDNGRFDRCQTLNWKKVPNPYSVEDPRDTPEIFYWGCGYLASLTIIVEEDATSDEATSTDGSETEVADSDTAATDSEEDESPITVKKVLFGATDIRFR